MSAALFLLATLWVLFGVCAALGLLGEHAQARAVDLRHGLLIILVAFAGVAPRGGPLAELGWPPMLLACWLTYRFIRMSSDRIRARKLLGRALTHT